MKRRIGLGLLSVAVVLGLSACKDVTETDACDQVGSEHTNEDGTKFKCIINPNNGKGFWWKV